MVLRYVGTGQSTERNEGKHEEQKKRKMYRKEKLERLT